MRNSREADDAGLQYSRARYYVPQVARFVSEDLLPGKLQQPATQNLYAYGLNNPMSFVDPLGTVAECKPRCARIFFDCVLDGLLPGVSTVVQGLLGGADITLIMYYNQALQHAAERGLTYPQKSSIFRDLLGTSALAQYLRNAIAPIILDYYVMKCLNEEYQAYKTGRCTP